MEAPPQKNHKNKTKTSKSSETKNKTHNKHKHNNCIDQHLAQARDFYIYLSGVSPLGFSELCSTRHISYTCGVSTWAVRVINLVAISIKIYICVSICLCAF